MPRHVILGVGAGISAYKACEVLRRLTESGCEVRVVPTRDALRFVGEATWAALSGRPAVPDLWADVHEVPHVRLGQWADLVFVAPATADRLAKAAAGRALPGRVRARHAHRDVGAPGHSGQCEPAAGPGRARARSGLRTADRPGHRDRPPAR